jgi:hypothetical protein
MSADEPANAVCEARTPPATPAASAHRHNKVNRIIPDDAGAACGGATLLAIIA